MNGKRFIYNILHSLYFVSACMLYAAIKLMICSYKLNIKKFHLSNRINTVLGMSLQFAAYFELFFMLSISSTCNNICYEEFMVPFEIVPLIFIANFCFFFCLLLMVWVCLVSNIECMHLTDSRSNEIHRLCMKNDALFIRRHSIRLHFFIFNIVQNCNAFFTYRRNFFVTDNLSLWHFFSLFFSFLLRCLLFPTNDIFCSCTFMKTILFSARFVRKMLVKKSHIFWCIKQMVISLLIRVLWFCDTCENFDPAFFLYNLGCTIHAHNAQFYAWHCNMRHLFLAKFCRRVRFASLE